MLRGQGFNGAASRFSLILGAFSEAQKVRRVGLQKHRVPQRKEDVPPCSLLIAAPW